MDWQSVAIHEYKNTSEIGQYKSLTDVSKTPIIVEDIDYNNHVCQKISNTNEKIFIDFRNLKIDRKMNYENFFVIQRHH
jgi:hypothetical protein